MTETQSMRSRDTQYQREAQASGSWTSAKRKRAVLVTRRVSFEVAPFVVWHWLCQCSSVSKG